MTAPKLYAESYEMMTVENPPTEPSARVPQLLLTLPEVGRVLAISRSKVYDLLNSNALPSVHIGRSRRVRFSDVEAFIQQGSEQLQVVDTEARVASLPRA